MGIVSIRNRLYVHYSPFRAPKIFLGGIEKKRIPVFYMIKLARPSTTTISPITDKIYMDKSVTYSSYFKGYKYNEQ